VFDEVDMRCDGDVGWFDIAGFPEHPNSVLSTHVYVSLAR
jgi:hypothetical protein